MTDMLDVKINVIYLFSRKSLNINGKWQRRRFVGHTISKNNGSCPESEKQAHSVAHNCY